LENDINSKAYPISLYRLLAGVGIVVIGAAVAILYLSRRVHNRTRASQNASAIQTS
jgi:hypothetical protein